MQHRHFKAIAATIASFPFNHQYERLQMANHFADSLAGTNPKFDRERFVAAATGNPMNGRDK